MSTPSRRITALSESTACHKSAAPTGLASLVTGAGMLSIEFSELRLPPRRTVSLREAPVIDTDPTSPVPPAVMLAPLPMVRSELVFCMFTPTESAAVQAPLEPVPVAFT